MCVCVFGGVCVCALLHVWYFLSLISVCVCVSQSVLLTLSLTSDVKQPFGGRRGGSAVTVRLYALCKTGSSDFSWKKQSLT